MTENRLRPDSNDLLFVVGEVGRQYFMHRGIRIDEQFSYTAQKPTLPRARVITSRILELFGNDDMPHRKISTWSRIRRCCLTRSYRNI